jgi:peptidoglycan/LPS O-acetylase OafA/YrhL
MGEIKSIINEPENLKEDNRHFFQIDSMKAIMIFLVIFDHTIPWDMKNYMGVAFWERISIPVFLVIMGFNMGLSFRRKGDISLKELYSESYFKKKIQRYITPFLILYVFSTIVGLIIYKFDFYELIMNQFLPHWAPGNLLMGILPFWGPGNWSLPIIFESILVMPIIYKAFSKKPKLSLILCFIIEFSAQLFVYFVIGEITSYVEFAFFLFILCSIFFYFSAIGLGMWFSNGYDVMDKRNLFMWILFPLSIIYLIAYQFFDFRFNFIRGDYHFFVFPYSAFLFLIGMKLLPKNSKNNFTKAIAWIGKSTYHILLTQIFYFAIVYAIYGDHYRASIIGINLVEDLVSFFYLIINWIICIPLGVLWYVLEIKIRRWQLIRNSS